MNLLQKYGKTALVAGASEGIGAAFAKYLAEAGMDLVLVARRTDKLNDLAGRLKSEFGIKITCITCDLADSNALKLITESMNENEISLMVYNAALSYIGPFLSSSSEDDSNAVSVNILAPLQMVRYFGGKMVEKKKGAIILMASLAGFQGSGYLSVYASTKAFNRVLAESLWYEWKGKGVDVIACCAGATSTPNFINTNPEKTSVFAPRVLSPAEIPAQCFNYLGKQPSFITGRGNRVASFFMQKILSRKMAIKIMGNNTRKMYRL